MAATRRWKCGVCSTKAGDLVCSGCVSQEGERRRVERADRLDVLRRVREAAAVAAQKRQDAVQNEARLEKEAADECRMKEVVRDVTQRVAEERIKVASAAFALKHHRDLLLAAESQLNREATSAVEMKEALLDGLRGHTENAALTLRQRRWRKVVQLFVLIPISPSKPSSIPTSSPIVSAATDRGLRKPGYGDVEGGEIAFDARSGAGAGSAGEEGGKRQAGDGGWGGGVSGGARGPGPGAAASVISGVSTLMDLPLPNNGEYSQVPSDVLMAALGLLARLVVGVASCLGVPLPHPLFPTASTRYATISVDSSPRERSSQYPLCPLSKLAEIGVMGAASSVCNTVGAFDTALDLLRSDVVHLCVEGAKVPVDRLWPAGALLLNLWELQQHAIAELRSSSPMVDVPLPMPRDPSERAEEPRQAMLGGARRYKDGAHRLGGGNPARDLGGGGERTRGSALGQGRESGRSNNEEDDFGDGVTGRTTAGAPEDEEATYEFIVDSGVMGSEARERGRGSSGSRWASWGSRLAAAGSASGLG